VDALTSPRDRTASAPLSLSEKERRRRRPCARLAHVGPCTRLRATPGPPGSSPPGVLRATIRKKDPPVNIKTFGSVDERSLQQLDELAKDGARASKLDGTWRDSTSRAIRGRTPSRRQEVDREPGGVQRTQALPPRPGRGVRRGSEGVGRDRSAEPFSTGARSVVPTAIDGFECRGRCVPRAEGG